MESVQLQMRTKPKAGDVSLHPIDQLKYSYIPAGSFVMGCVEPDKKCNSDEKPSHTVNISKGFWFPSGSFWPMWPLRWCTPFY